MRNPRALEPWQPSSDCHSCSNNAQWLNPIVKDTMLPQITRISVILAVSGSEHEQMDLVLSREKRFSIILCCQAHQLTIEPSSSSSYPTFPLLWRLSLKFNLKSGCVLLSCLGRNERGGACVWTKSNYPISHPPFNVRSTFSTFFSPTMSRVTRSFKRRDALFAFSPLDASTFGIQRGCNGTRDAERGREKSSHSTLM
jgi:hypothetical protein